MITIQERPICFWCDVAILTNSEMVFEAPCGHDDHKSAVFHAACLFSWRERRAEFENWLSEVRKRWMEDHQERHERGEL